MMEGILVFLTLFSIAERDFFDTAVAQQEQGYHWEQLAECQAPDPTAKSLVMTTGTGEQLICWKLVK